jgi:hypothetical protein
MMGTLAGFLARKQIRTDADHFRAWVEGDIEDINGVLKITQIRVRYDIQVPKGKAGEAREAMEQYLPHCPGAQSVMGCIRIHHDAGIEEGNGPS